MIKGVEILNQTPIMESANWCNALILVGVLCGFVVGIISSTVNHDKGDIVFIVITSIILGLIVGLAISMIARDATEHPTDKYIYKVIISDNVNFKEFNEKYQIINQEGKIYTIQNKN